MREKVRFKSLHKALPFMARLTNYFAARWDATVSGHLLGGEPGLASSDPSDAGSLVGCHAAVSLASPLREYDVAGV